MMTPKETVNDEAIRLANAYEEVFGPAERRSERQKLVLANLEEQCFGRKTANWLLPTGEIAPLRSAANEGRRQVYLHILQQLQLAHDGLEKNKTTVKR